MMTLPIGIISFFLVLMASSGKASWGLYSNPHAIIIVIGGTAAILAFSTPWNVLRALLRGLKDLLNSEENFERFEPALASLMKTRSTQGHISCPLIDYAQQLWEQGINPELFIALVSQKREDLEREHADAIQALRNLTKYPPALGMTGTVMGLVSLFSNLSADNRASLGPSLALAMTATFFGLIVSNGLLNPLADRLSVKHVRQRRLYVNIYQVLLLINRGDAMTLIQDEVAYRAAA